MGDQLGSLDVAQNRVRGASSYVYQLSQTPQDAASWKHAAVSATSSCTIAGLTSGQRYYVRVAAIGTAGQGPWSDHASQRAS